MTTQNQNIARELDIEQDVNNFKVVPARKGVENLGFGGEHGTSLFENPKSMWSPSEQFGSPDMKKSDLPRRFDLQNENDSRKEQSPSTRKFNPSSSAFRSADSVFSKTPGPGSKPSRTQFDPIDLQTPSKPTKSGQDTPTDALAFKLFEGDDHTWTQARQSLQTQLQEPSMTPLMNSMLGQFLDSSPVPTHRNTYKHSPEATDTATARQLDAEVEADLDIRNLAKNFDAAMFQSSLANSSGSNTRNFGLSESNTAITTSSSLTDPMRMSREAPLLFPPPDAFSAEMNLADMHYEIDRLSQPSTGVPPHSHSTAYSAELEERPAVWNPADNFGFRSFGSSGASGARVGSGVSQSLPHLPSYYGPGGGSGGGMGMQHMQGSLLNNDSELGGHHMNTTISNNKSNTIINNMSMHSSWSGTPISAQGASNTSDYDAQLSFHKRTNSGNGPIYPADAYNHSQNSAYFATPKLQNWMEPSVGMNEHVGNVNNTNSGIANPLQGSISYVDSFSALASNLTDNFNRHGPGRNNTANNSIATSNSNNANASTALSQQLQFALGPQFNASAPAFHPKQHTTGSDYSNAEYGGGDSGNSSNNGVGSSVDYMHNTHTNPNSGSTSGVNSNRDSWDSLHALHNPHTTHNTHTAHNTHTTLPLNNSLPGQGMPGMRPPQTHYEPPLPTTTGIRVGKTRNSGSYEFRPFGSGGSGGSGGIGGASGANSGANSVSNSTDGILRSSTESESSHLSRNKHLLHQNNNSNNNNSSSGGYGSGGSSGVYGGHGVSSNNSGGVYAPPYTNYTNNNNNNTNHPHGAPQPHFPNAPHAYPHNTHTNNTTYATHAHSTHTAHSSHSAHTAHPTHTTHTTHSTHYVKEVNKNAFPRAEIAESPQGKLFYKEFHRVFLNLKEKHELGYHKQRKHALSALEAGPQDIKWRIHLDLADLYKRNNFMDEARQHFAQVCRLQPRAATGWLEWSKMDEENGKIGVALEILLLGLRVCTANEALLTKAIKLNERLHKYSDARGMLSKLKYESIDKVWKSVLEGALFEARTGNVHIARKLFKYLISHVPWYGPIYFEAFRLEEKEHRDDAAYEIILKGLNELPRYGPLWFGLFRIMERRDAASENRAWQQGARPRLENTVHETDRAVRLISKELTWKVHFERSQCEERAAEIAALGKHLHSTLTLQECRDEMLCDARLSLTRSLLTCPGNLRWRVLLVGARLELGVGAIDKARALLRRAAKEVPVKSKSYVYLECSRVEEYCGNLDTARVLLSRAKREQEGEWKLFLESVLIEARAGLIERAATVAREAVQAHDGTGRLWAIYIQLCHRLEVRHFYDTEAAVLQTRLLALCGQSGGCGSGGNSNSTLVASAADKQWLSKSHIILQAITQVPKSGEVWCERGRCQLNPLSPHCFDLSQAQRSLCFAIQFTPQYGDTFVEYVRLELLCQVLLPRVLEALGLPVLSFVRSFLSEDPEADLVEITHDARRVGLRYNNACSVPVPCGAEQKQKRAEVVVLLERMQYELGDMSEQYAAVVIKNLNRRSVNADPNYGSAWFHCRAQPYDVPSTVLLTARLKIAHELCATQEVYARALLHYIRRCLLERRSSGGGGSSGARVEKSSTVSSAVVGMSSTSSGGVNIDSAVNAILSSPTRSASAPAGRTKPLYSQNHAGNDSGITGSGGVIGNSSGGVDVTKSLEGSFVRASTTHNTAHNTARNTPSPYQLTAMGGRRSPLRDAALLHATSASTSGEEGEGEGVSHRYSEVEAEESEEVRAQREAELLLQLVEVDAAMVAKKSGSAVDSSVTTPHTTTTTTTTTVDLAPRNTQHWTSLNTVHLTPFVSLQDGALFCSTDFITGLVEMNRSMYNNNLSDEVRRKNLFGSDQIIS